MSARAPPNQTSTTIPEAQEINEKLDRALSQLPDQGDWSLEAGTHERFKEFKVPGSFVRFSNLIRKKCLSVRAKGIWCRGACALITSWGMGRES